MRIHSGLKQAPEKPLDALENWFYSNVMNRFVRLLFALLFVTTFAAAQAAERPNVILIFTDDQGWADLGAHGAVDDIRTPNLDRMAAEGVLMSDGYITAPQCIPSRAGLMTGRYQTRFGVDDNAYAPLPLTERTVADHLSDASYETGMVGKWHLDPNWTSREWVDRHYPGTARKPAAFARTAPFHHRYQYFPGNRGFKEVFFGELNRYWATYTLDGKPTGGPGTWIETEGDRLDVQTEAALTFLRQTSREKPFFLYLAYFAPHVPLESSEKYLERFPGEMPERRRYALAMLSAVDDGVGRILDLLAERGIDEETLVFFISDNGAPLKIDKEDKPISFRGGAWDGSLNDPWVGEKGMLTEGGIRVPFLARWTGTLPAGEVYREPVISLDATATALAVAGVEPEVPLDGVNLIPYLTGAIDAPPHEALFWRFWSQSAIRMDRWKLIHFRGESRLYDLRSEAHESRAVTDEHPAVARRLEARLRDWAAGLHRPGLDAHPGNGQEEAWFRHYLDWETD